VGIPKESRRTKPANERFGRFKRPKRSFRYIAPWWTDQRVLTKIGENYPKSSKIMEIGEFHQGLIGRADILMWSF
jgi:hypothetical protein